MSDHRLKTWAVEFEATQTGRKTHEWRRDDRTPRFEVGDRLILEEFHPCPDCRGTGRRDGLAGSECCCAPHGSYTGGVLVVLVTFVTRYPAHGVPPGWVVMSISRRNPRLDPEPGDRVTSAEGERAEVLAILRDEKDCDPLLGPLPHVEARVDPRSGNRRRSIMSLETWRATFASDPSSNIPDARL